MNETDAIKAQKGKWAEKGVPHKGWNCCDIEDLGEPKQICEMCESQTIRYVHHMVHPQFAVELKVGCVCAGNMEENILNAKGRDAMLKSRSAKRKRWLSRKWKISAKGNDYIEVDGYRITIFFQNNTWAGCIDEINGNYKDFSRRKYESKDKMKLACFDLLTKRLAEEQDIPLWNKE